MPFDRLPGRIDSPPQIFRPVNVPPPPVMNWGESIVPAIDKIANAFMYNTPRERQKRKLEDLNLSTELELLPYKRNALRRQYQSGGKDQLALLRAENQVLTNRKLKREDQEAEIGEEGFTDRTNMADQLRKEAGYISSEAPLPQPEVPVQQPAFNPMQMKPMKMPTMDSLGTTMRPNLSRLRIYGDDEDEERYV